jgi:hypothetical protein
MAWVPAEGKPAKTLKQTRTGRANVLEARTRMNVVIMRPLRERKPECSMKVPSGGSYLT